jgi:pheromone alpha factor receptor
MSSNTFDPVLQNITFLNTNGGVVNVTFAYLDTFVLYNTRVAISYAAQLGACLLMLVVTAILTSEGKRTKPIFVLNILALLAGSLRAFFCLFFAVSPFSELYAYAAMDFTYVSQSAYQVSVVGTVMPILLTIFVDASLILQTHSVVKVLQRKYYIPIAILSCLIYLLALGFRMAEAITNAKAILSDNPYFPWIAQGALVTETITICFFSMVFTTKLGWTIYTRKQMGFKQWTYMQILAAMGGCTMLLPGKIILFAIFQFLMLTCLQRSSPAFNTRFQPTFQKLVPLS